MDLQPGLPVGPLTPKPMHKVQDPSMIERAVLDWFAQHCADPALVAQIRSAVAGEREVTSIGIFTELVVPESLVSFPVPSQDGLAFEGCALYAAELEPHADCILHTQGGRLSSLEIYAVGDGHPLDVTAFEVRSVAINFVDLRKA